MKRNESVNQKNRRKSSAQYLAGEGNSKYAAKVKAGRQMYGPGCCAHTIKSPFFNKA